MILIYIIIAIGFFLFIKIVALLSGKRSKERGDGKAG
jgi:hypothetical protein